MGLSSVLYDFANWSTVCGVPHIANAKCKRTRLFWALIFLIMLTIFLVQLYLMIKRFLGFPIAVTTIIAFEQLNFPAVTICNLNPYKYNAVQDNAKFATIQQLMEAYQDATYDGYMGTKTAAADPWGLSDLYEEPYDLDATARDALIIEMSQFTEADKQPILYDFNELVAECSFSSKPCSQSDFTSFVDAVYGACYSFNGQVSNNTKFLSNRAGMPYGLKLLLTPTQALPDTQDSKSQLLPTSKLTGARVSVHAQGAYPSLEGFAISVGVGFQTAVSLTLTQTGRQKKPYGICVDREPADTDYYKDFNYNMETCFLGCKQRYNVEQCGCAHPRYSSASDQTLCTAADLKCLQTLKGDQSNKADIKLGPLQQCGCLPPCNEDSYSATTSLARFPSATYYVAVDVDSSESIGPCEPSTTMFEGNVPDTVPDGQAPPNGSFRADACRQWYEDNALLLQECPKSAKIDPDNGTWPNCLPENNSVYFETLKYETYLEQPSYGVSSVLNDLGGQAGLWLGLSIISVVEVCGLIVIICLYIGGGRNMLIHTNREEFINSDHRMKDLDDIKKDLDEMESGDEGGHEDKKENKDTPHDNENNNSTKGKDD